MEPVHNSMINGIYVTLRNTICVIVKMKKVCRKAKIRNRYNQIPNLTWNTIWKMTKTKEDTTLKRASRSASSQALITLLQATDKKA